MLVIGNSRHRGEPGHEQAHELQYVPDQLATLPSQSQLKVYLKKSSKYLACRLPDQLSVSRKERKIVSIVRIRLHLF